ncbi:cell division protein FtsA [Roseococcus suduntuyensis]|uniref:Cell division protein FtsA n=1 Tax=Roseococcus suduntuyensis TaxID=455361 RepID=A0A840AEG4_9PROT|nr:cell division protein FtsA [Roseococcus suduntuyensis]MBB3898475.1 cell division protein FtsA [Roseococcus suduntuyensis]
MNEIIRHAAADTPPARGLRLGRARAGAFGVLDIGTTKIVCIIARIESDGTPRALGFGWQKARGIKAGSVVDMEEAERSIRAAVAGAEQMADTRLQGVIVNLSCGQPGGRIHHIDWPIGGRAVTEADLRSILQEGVRRTHADGREVVHCFPAGFMVDETGGVEDPRAMVCERLQARLHVVDAASHALFNLGQTLHRCELEAEEMIASPFAAGLATLVDDERELGAICVDMGGGTTSLACFAEGRLLHTAQLPVGGWQVTNDLARVLSTPISHAERLKTMHGSVLESDEDRGELLPVPMVGEEEDQIARIPREMIVKIMRPRLEESFELLRDRLEASGLPMEMRRRVVLTGGASQVIGVRELAARVLGKPVTVRLGRPRIVRGLPETAAGPAFASCIGLLAWAAGEGRPLLDITPGPAAPKGMVSRAFAWLRERL